MVGAPGIGSCEDHGRCVLQTQLCRQPADGEWPMWAASGTDALRPVAATDDPCSTTRLFVMDVFVLLLIVALANVRHSIMHDATDPDLFCLLHFDDIPAPVEEDSDGLI